MTVPEGPSWSIITIFRGTLSGGRNLATCLAHNLGYRLISREVLAEGAQRDGIHEERLARGLEQPPSFWDRFRMDRQIHLTVIRASPCQLVREDDVVYHEHAGHLLLQGVEHVLRVRVIAPLAFRVKAAMLEKVTIEMACKIVVCMLERPGLPMTPESLRRLEDLYLASHIKARLFLNPTEVKEVSADWLGSHVEST